MKSYTDLHSALLPILHDIGPCIPYLDAGYVLDVGCGQGEKSTFIAAHAGADVRLVGVDIDVAGLRAARSSIPWCIAGDAQALPLCNECCSAAYCIAALSLFSNPHAALGEMQRVLHQGGWALIVTATQLWAPVVRWPEPLSKQLCELYQASPAAQYCLGTPACSIASHDLTGELESLLERSGFQPAWIRIFLTEAIDAGASTVEAELSLLPWPALRSLIGDQLSTADLACCDQLAACAEVEICSIVLAALGLKSNKVTVS